MKSWRVSEWCEPEQMSLDDIPIPEPGPGEVRIKNHAAALNFYDILLIQGRYQVKPELPFTPGSEVAGQVDAVGPDVTRFAVGDRVQAMASGGGYAEYSLASVDKTFRIPDAMSFTEGAAMIVIYQTSYFALKHRTTIREGEWLLVHAGAGGVGLSAMQIGKAMGARVIATAGSAEKLDFCLSQGAEHAFNYGDEAWVAQVKKATNGHGADVIYDPVGGDIFDLSGKCIAPEGRLLVIGFAGGRIPSIAANRILLKNISVIGCYWGGYLEHHPRFMGEAQAELFAMYEAGRIKPIVSRAYPLSDAAAALRAMAERKTYGKVVLAIGQ
ncbi:MAG TPA: NADPH:quinone oxidoreductase family protein [Blastocatellia bacterium]|nr:NADPH:quinone oxidoreductase family protein [Blastocatellia bacterium]